MSLEGKQESIGAQLEEEDIVEILEDDEEGSDVPMYEDDDNKEYDVEIVIGEPESGQDNGMMEEEDKEGIQREDNSWGVNALHNQQQSIFAISLHPHFPNPPLAITGGEDDVGFIFCPLPLDTESPQKDFSADTFPPIVLTGHTDSVVAVGFSFDGEFAATGGMDGKILIWQRLKINGSTSVGVDEWKSWSNIKELETGSEITWLQWHPKGNVIAAGCEDATVWLWNLPNGNITNVLISHTMSCTSGLFPPPTGRQLLTTSIDSTLCLWDPRDTTPVWKSSIFVSSNSPEIDPSQHGITALSVSPNGQIAAVGSSGGQVKLVNLTKGDTLATKFTGHAEGESIEALAFVDLLNGAAGGNKGVVLVSGATDGRSFVWDVATGRMRAQFQHDEPITALVAHPYPQLHLVTTASADGTLKTWDIRTGDLVDKHVGHTGVVNGVTVAPVEGGKVVISAGDEGVSLVWRM
ncbi:uncharacterized protein L203_104768 [Cryptococcus depauperatus CBS 7841]|uniref:Uncharacterized protein n=1 Tax=Cryptococcus depauperatus CBS 7841 TaxID=1295531 RepID=A0A1E3INJ7_9TREE|nr:ribosome assembly protein SQT1 [Cryptococcus depauperatus CBS 7841]